MECQLRSMSEAAAAATSSNTQQEEIPEGKVGQVCREWLVREDGVMAYKLQHEEIEQHYGDNRYRNRVVRSDLPVAKTLQQSEEEEAEMVRQAYEKMLLEQERADEQIAKRLQEQLVREDVRRQQSTEAEDQKLAIQLQEKERQRIERKKREKELDRERRQVEYVHSMQISDAGGENIIEPNGAAFSAIEPRRSDNVDLSEFLIEPPAGLSQVELKRFLENQDEELAKLLQEQESKVKSERGGQSFRDLQMAIEAQDRELARVLQEQERAKVKRAKEKARQKALLLQQQQQQDMERIEEAQPSQTKPKLRHRDLESNRSSDGSENEMFENERVSTTSRGGGGGGGGGVSNVAMILDPTYSRRKSSKDSSLERPMLQNRVHGQSLSAGSSVDNSNTPSPMKSPSSQHSSSAGSSPLLEALRNDYLESIQDDDDPVPPYMPIQGQRRLGGGAGTIDKPKKKNNKQSCKMQ